jgi:3-dehydroquinate synthase
MRISLSKFQCDIILTKSDLSHLNDFMIKNKGNYSRCFCISDSNVFSLNGLQIHNLIKDNGLAFGSLVLPPGESEKNLASVKLCWEKMLQFGLDRKSLVIGLGGGVITDLAGFAASCYMRGIDLINIPTTLLGMVDAAIGGKNGINFSQTKNLIGAIHHPKLILIAPHYLKDLPERELCSGLAEIIKAGVIWDAELFEYLERFMPDILKKDQEKLKSIIAKACKVKSEIVRIDEKEHNLRSILNYGHTIGHAIEAATNYAQFTHGEAISIGMSCIAHIGKQLGYVDDDFIARQDRLCLSAGLPIRLPKGIAIDDLMAIMIKDKKTVGGKINLILPRKFGKVDKISDIDPMIIKSVLEKQKD